jgi:hypothetical protein
MVVKLGDAGVLVWWQRSRFISVVKSWVMVVGFVRLPGLKHSNERRKFVAPLCASQLGSLVASSVLDRCGLSSV